jgi:hypothetical protein
MPSMTVKYVDAPEQYKEFIFDREMLIGAWADSLVPVMGEIGVKFMRLDTPSCEVLIRRKDAINSKRRTV